MSKEMGKHACLLATFIAPKYCAQPDNADTVNKSNKPLSVASDANLQGYYTPKLFDINVHTSDGLLCATSLTSTRPAPYNGYSTGTWTFDLKNDTHYIPLVLGGGKAWKSGSNSLNASSNRSGSSSAKAMGCRRSRCLPESTSPSVNKDFLCTLQFAQQVSA
jgi:hypothetical protein